MSAASSRTDQAATRANQHEEDDPRGAIATVRSTVEGIDKCLRRWKASRHEGQAVLTELSNALLLRTYVDKGRGGDGTGSASAVWGALANAGSTVSRVSIAAEARVRRLHGDLSVLQDAMLAAAGGIRRHAQEARRRCCSRVTPEEEEGLAQADNRRSITNGSRSPTAPAKKVQARAAAAWNGEGAGGGGSSGGGGLSDDDAEAVIGGGYSLSDVADAASAVADMLLKEALVTATIAQGVGKECTGGNREALTVYAAAWMMQPYVDARRVRELEIMVEG
ncbi:unnamed protein product [Scytosiphon promiscuus]